MANTPKKIDDDEKGMHDGHRGRLIETVYQVGLDRVSPIQALEFVLFYIFPRGDVNPLAHRLLKRFNDFPTVLEASVEDLMQVKGVGEKAAKKIRALLDVYFYYTQEKLASVNTIESVGDFYDFLEQLLRFHTNEELFIFGVQPSGLITKGRRFARGSFNMVSISALDISLYLSTYKVDSIYIVHNHPNGKATASKQDMDSYKRLKTIVEATGCQVIDSLVVGMESIFSMDLNRTVKFFRGEKEDAPVIALKSSK